MFFLFCIHIYFSDLQDDLSAIQDDEVRSRYCSQRLLCRTLAGNNVYVLTITSPNNNDDNRFGHGLQKMYFAKGGNEGGRLLMRLKGRLAGKRIGFTRLQLL